MKTLDKGSDKIQKICDALRFETLEPAKKEASKIIEEAEAKSETIIAEARRQADEIIEEARRKMEKERNVFDSSLEQAAGQSLETLRQRIEKSLFNPELAALLEERTTDPEVIAKLLSAICNAIEKEGISADIEALIPKTVNVKEVNALLAERILSKLEEKSVALGGFPGGVQVYLKDRRMTIDLSDQTLKELLASYVRKDFRKVIFAT